MMSGTTSRITAAGAWLVLLIFSASARCEPPFATSWFTLSDSRSVPDNAPMVLGEIRSAPVLERGEPGAWDHVDVLNPSVIRVKDRYFNYYSGFDGRVWRTGVATSQDGIRWRKFDRNPILAPEPGTWDAEYIAANGAAVVLGGNVLYFYQGRDKTGRSAIGLARSSDGFHFTKTSAPVLSAGPPHTWDGQGVADPYVVKQGGFLYLYYLGQDERNVQRLGVARSKDGSTWERLVSNPILDVGAAGSFDERGLGEPSVVHQPPFYYLFYTGRDRAEMRNIGYAISTDGTHWKKM